MTRLEFFLLPKGALIRLSIPGEIEATGRVAEPSKRCRLVEFDQGSHGQTFMIVDIDDSVMCEQVIANMTRE